MAKHIIKLFTIHNFIIFTGINFILFLLIAHLYITKQTNLPVFFGIRSVAIFDLWSIQHFASGVLIGSILVHSKFKLTNIIFIVLLISFTWEAIELSMEIGCWGNTIYHWKNGYEHWANRFISDPLLVLFGSLLSKRLKNFWKVILVFSIIWLILNVTSNQSTDIQNLLFKSPNPGGANENIHL